MGDPCLGGVGSLGADPCGTFGHTGGQRRSVGNLGTLGGHRRSVGNLGTLGASAAVWAMWAHWGSAPQNQHTFFLHTQVPNV